MRQADILAAAGLFALDHNIDRLADDHENRRLSARRIADVSAVSVFPTEIATNILFLDVTGRGRDAREIAQPLQEQGIRIGVEGSTRMRVVTHLDVSSTGIERAADALAKVFLVNAEFRGGASVAVSQA